jgi:methionyl-tRNA formyltransferase
MARLAFLGTPELAVLPLEGLVAAGHEVRLVVSRPDRRRGRGGALSPSPVKQAALDHGIETSDDLDRLRELELDGCVVVAYGRLIPDDLVKRFVMLNLHFSLLPRWRGAAPVERAILAGDVETGVCVMRVEPELDTGPVYASRRVSIGEKDLEALRGELVAEGTSLLVELLAAGFDGLPEPVAQIGTPSYASKVQPSELELDFSHSAVELARLVRLGRAFSFQGGRRLRILGARALPGGSGSPGLLDGLVVSTGDGGLELLELQPEGKRAMPAAEWRRGLREAGELRLGREAPL